MFKTANEANTIHKAELNAFAPWYALNANQLPSSGNPEDYKISDNLRRILYFDSRVNFGVFMFTIGSKARLASFCVFFILTQPVVGWVPVLVLVITAAVWLWVNKLQGNLCISKEHLSCLDG